jgi:hypothetical protein
LKNKFLVSATVVVVSILSNFPRRSRSRKRPGKRGANHHYFFVASQDVINIAARKGHELADEKVPKRPQRPGKY